MQHQQATTVPAKCTHVMPKKNVVESWGFSDWLEYEVTDGLVSKVWCKVCINYYEEKQGSSSMNTGQAQMCDGQVDAYVKGTNIVKKCNAVTHFKSGNHVHAVNSLHPVEDSTIVQMLTHWDTIKHQQMIKLFDIAYTVAYSEQSFQMFRTIALFEKKHGVEIGDNYLHDKACQRFIGDISMTFLDNLKGKIQMKPFYCPCCLMAAQTSPCQKRRSSASSTFMKEFPPSSSLGELLKIETEMFKLLFPYKLYCNLKYVTCCKIW